MYFMSFSNCLNSLKFGLKNVKLDTGEQWTPKLFIGIQWNKGSCAIHIYKYELY